MQLGKREFLGREYCGMRLPAIVQIATKILHAYGESEVMWRSKWHASKQADITPHMICFIHGKEEMQRLKFGNHQT